MAGRRKVASKRAVVRLQVCLTLAEADLVVTEAEAKGMTISVYIKQTLLLAIAKQKQ